MTYIQQRGISKHIRNRAFRRRQKDEKYMEKIIITFPDGNKREYDAGITAEKVAQTISISLSKKAISADLDGVIGTFNGQYIKTLSYQLIL